MPLTDAQRATLRTELETDPGERGYAALLAAGNDPGLADLLNARTIAGRVTIAPDVLRAALMNLGVWTRLCVIRRVTETPAEIGGAADTVIDVCTPGGLQRVDLDAPAATQLFDLFVTAELLDADDRAYLLALADTLISRAEELLGAGITVSRDDIAGAR